MPANQGRTVDWHPGPDLTGTHSIAAAQTERYKPASLDDFVSFLGGVGLPEFEDYDEADKTEVLKEEVGKFFVRGAFADDIVDAYYRNEPLVVQSPLHNYLEVLESMVEYPVDESPETESPNVPTMKVVTMRRPDGTVSANSHLSTYQRGA